MTGYSYLDKFGVLHCAQDAETAKKAAKNGKTIETNLCGGNGYMEENEQTVFVYADSKEFYHKGNAKNGVKITEETFATKYPGTYAVYKKLI